MESGKLIARAMLGFDRQFHIKRLGDLATLAPGAITRLHDATSCARVVRAGKEILAGERPVILVSGWACRMRVLPDGRRQVFGHLIPGDVLEQRIGAERNRASVVAQVPTMVIDAPMHSDDDEGESLARACRLAVRAERHYAEFQVLRLGRMTAVERVIHLFLEFGERLEAIGAGDAARFPLPISQEILADTLGLTKVHVNRTLQSLRHDGIVSWKGGYAELANPARLASRVYFDRRLAEAVATATPWRRHLPAISSLIAPAPRTPACENCAA